MVLVVEPGVSYRGGNMSVVDSDRPILVGEVLFQLGAVIGRSHGGWVGVPLRDEGVELLALDRLRSCWVVLVSHAGGGVGVINLC